MSQPRVLVAHTFPHDSVVNLHSANSLIHHAGQHSCDYHSGLIKAEDRSNDREGSPYLSDKNRA